MNLQQFRLPAYRSVKGRRARRYRRMEQDRAEMTPLELLAVGVIVVLVWWAGFFAAEGSYERADFGFWPLMILVLGFTLVGTSLLQLLILGIKEAAK